MIILEGVVKNTKSLILYSVNIKNTNVKVNIQKNDSQISKNR